MADPVTGEIVDRPAIAAGVDVRSRTCRYAGSGKPLGGAVIDRVDHGWRVVDTHRGQPEYHIIDDDDVDWAVYTGLIRVDVLEGRIRILHEDAARHSRDHMAALLRLSHVVATGGVS